MNNQDAVGRSGWDACLEIVPGSTSQLHLEIANWCASSQLGFLTVVVECSVVFHCPSKAPMGSGHFKSVCMYVQYQSIANFIGLNLMFKLRNKRKINKLLLLACINFVDKNNV